MLGERFPRPDEDFRDVDIIGLRNSIKDGARDVVGGGNKCRSAGVQSCKRRIRQHISCLEICRQAKGILQAIHELRPVVAAEIRSNRSGHDIHDTDWLILKFIAQRDAD